MSTGESETPGVTSWLSPSLIVVIISLIGYMRWEPPLQSVRPGAVGVDKLPPPPPIPGVSSIHSRLWDDPLLVANDHFNRSREGAIGLLLRPDATGDREPNTVAQFVETFLAPLAVKTETDPGKQDTIGQFFETLLDKLELKDDDKVLCMPVLISGEPYSVDTEQRKRITYAVLSALGTCHYDLEYPDRLSYITVPVHVDDRILDKGAAGARAQRKRQPVSLVVPVKLFSRSHAWPSVAGDYKAVFVCWINEAQLGARPLKVIAQVVRTICDKVEKRKAAKRVSIAILGPTSSDLLLDMAREDRSLHAAKQNQPAAPKDDYFSPYLDAVLYSGMATVSSDSLSDGDSKALKEFVSKERRELTDLRTIRTIGTDESLLRLLVNELSLRDAWLAKAVPGRPEGVALEPGRYVVLVSERDTLFGRSLPVRLRRLFPELLAEVKRDEDPLKVFSYLQGLDGQLPGKSENEPQRRVPGDLGTPESSSESKPGASLFAQSAPTDSLSATGRSQFDYIRRLESELVEFQKEKRAAGERGIVAIGVLGTDVYDKLLVLRALRPHFTDVCFFTTDCDADYCLPQEHATSRNLLVASHFGLMLHPSLQREAPMFRDSYQTASYFQCLLALGDDTLSRKLQCDPDPWRTDGRDTIGLHPLAFEVARHGLYQLTIPGQGYSKHVHPPSPREAHWLQRPGHIVVLILTISCFLFLLARLAGIVPTSTTLILAILGVAILVVAASTAAVDHSRPDGEPFELFDGISSWPSTMVRLAALLLSVALLYKAATDLERDASKLEDLLRPDAALGHPHVDWWTRWTQGLRQFTSAVRKPFTSLRDQVFIAAWPSDRSLESPELHGQYRQRGQIGLRLLRSTFLSAIYLLFGMLLFRMLGLPVRPYRGVTAGAWSFWILMLAVGAMILLTFFIFDAIQLCQRFVRYCAEQRPAWPLDCKGMRQLREAKRPVNEDDDQELLTLRIIARRTHEVGYLVIYPFAVLLLMIISRHQVFDLFDFPPPILIVWGLSLGGILLFAAKLRREARRSRDKILSRLRDALSVVVARDDETSRLRAKQLQLFINEVRSEEKGAFQPFVKDPIVTALAALFGGTGGIMLLEQLLPYS
ncbi:MAG TPA: hypothetical protein VG826_06920 [Pirellulales bacterium]|nr:hypothetical protein [Pirellulales bacterium]